MHWTFRQAKRAVIFVIGSTVVLVGIAMMVLPGPAVIVIPAGLAILATEFVWARRLLKRFKQTATDMYNHVVGNNKTAEDVPREASPSETAQPSSTAVESPERITRKNAVPTHPPQPSIPAEDGDIP
jgi:hypothetical protein